MYYIVPNSAKRADICGYEPEEPHIAAEYLPERPEERNGHYLQLYADLDTMRIWWDYIKFPTNENDNELLEALRILTGGADDELEWSF